MTASFAVGAIIREPQVVLDRFVGWHLSLGAARIVLLFDDPEDPLLSAYADIPEVDAIRCTESFWREAGIRPKRAFPRRQNQALTHIYNQLEEDWLLNIDADELMHVTDRTISELLSSVPADVGAISVAPAEKVTLSADEVAFRTALDRRVAREVYGEDARFFRAGLAGHREGKSFIRRGLKNIRLRQHWAEGEAGRVASQLLGSDDGVWLLHFLQEDYEAWRAKVEWRMNSFGFPPGVKERVTEIMQDPDDPEVGFRDLFRRMSSVEPEVAKRLRSFGALFQFNVDFEEVARAELDRRRSRASA